MSCPKFFYLEHKCGYCGCDGCLDVFTSLQDYMAKDLVKITKGYVMHHLIVRFDQIEFARRREDVEFGMSSYPDGYTLMYRDLRTRLPKSVIDVFYICCEHTIQCQWNGQTVYIIIHGNDIEVVSRPCKPKYKGEDGKFLTDLCDIFETIPIQRPVEEAQKDWLFDRGYRQVEADKEPSIWGDDVPF